MDEILGENPFAMPGESGSMAEVLEAGEWEGEEPFRQEAAEARLDEWESELGEQPWSGEQERGWTRPGRHSGRRTAPAYPGPSLPSVGAPGGAAPPTPGRTQSPGAATGLATDATACPDVTYRNEPWTLGKPGRHQTAEGTATQQKVAESAAVRVLELGDFDVDDYRLRPAHRAILGIHIAGLATALRNGRVVAPVIISVQGRTSSSGSMSHNLALSRHRAVNVLTMIRCLTKQAGIEAQVQAKWTPVGESVSQTTMGDSVEDAGQRQVRVQVIAPRPTGLQPPAQQPGTGTSSRGPQVSGGGTPYRPGYPVRRLGFRGGRRAASRAAQICFEVVSVKRSRGFAWLRTSGLGTVSARIRVHDHRNRSAAFYVLQGVVLSAGGQLPAGPIGRLGPFARLAGIARRILRIASGAKIPTRGCRPTSVVAPSGDPMRQLSGTAVLVIPPAGSGRAAMHLRPRSARVRLARRLVPVRARRYPTPLIIVGRLRPLPQGFRWGVGQLPRTRAFGEAELNEYGELNEFGEWEGEGEGELNEYGEVSNEWGELSEAELGEAEGIGEYGELNELTEYGEWEAEGELNEYGEVSNEWGELGEAEFGELEGLGELNEYGEAEYGEWGEAEYGEWGESEYGEFEGLGELNEYGELGG
jgi:outer membrane protein OmpA-like peptidoglycan-associated protein